MRMIACCAALSMGCTAVCADVARVSRIVESREATIKDGKTTSTGGTLTVELSVVGPTAARANMAGEVRILKADAADGRDLRRREAPGKPGTDQPALRPIIRRTTVGRARGFVIDLKLAVPPRQTTGIALIQGSLKMLSGGRKRSVQVPGVLGQRGSTIKDDTLRKADLTARIDKGSPEPGFFDDRDREIILEVDGEMENFLSADLLDADGVPITDSRKELPADRGRKLRLLASRPLTNDDALRLNLITDQKRTNVPIRIENLPLP